MYSLFEAQAGNGNGNERKGEGRKGATEMRDEKRATLPRRMFAVPFAA